MQFATIRTPLVWTLNTLFWFNIQFITKGAWHEHDHDLLQDTNTTSCFHQCLNLICFIFRNVWLDHLWNWFYKLFSLRIIVKFKIRIDIWFTFDLTLKSICFSLSRKLTWTKFIPSTWLFTSLIRATLRDSSNLVNFKVNEVCTVLEASSSSSSWMCDSTH